MCRGPRDAARDRVGGGAPARPAQILAGRERRRCGEGSKRLGCSGDNEFGAPARLAASQKASLRPPRGRKSSSGTPKEFWGPRCEVVLADGEDRVHQLLGRILLRQHGPGGVGDYRVLMEIVGDLQERGLPLAPAGGLRSLLLPPMSASETPPFLAISSCWANSYWAWCSQPMRRIRSSRSRNGRVCLLGIWLANGVQRFTRAGWCASTLKMLKTCRFMAFFSTVVRSCRHGRQIAHGNAQGDFLS